ncbi:dihydrolipoyllysine-residue acetyltransferase component 2 of pyruvate dehydrogenase complex, mitochondrial-like [Physcomitrium patens]|uniref:2-oxoacid dehydrogenase acyltransferase catalytic domain-containing protein n=1 Tax=Physcomitrium patens TaxID=3218 RepID=A0A2K1IHE7_PHYPA|nr:hypothetical protein PHYPA_029299 [Physcomitrium patens]
MSHLCYHLNLRQKGTLKRVCPGVDLGDFELGTIMTFTLSCDHRAIDGAVGAQWLGAFKGFVQDPVTLML